MNSRRKGKVGELELCSELRELGYLNARRSAQYCGTAGDADIADAIPGVHIEVKRVQALNLEAAMAQALHDSTGTGNIPVVMHRKNRGEWLVTLRLQEMPSFARIVSAAPGQDAPDTQLRSSGSPDR